MKTTKCAGNITTTDRIYPSRYTLTSRRIVSLATNRGRIHITHTNAAGQQFTNTYAADADITIAA